MAEHHLHGSLHTGVHSQGHRLRPSGESGETLITLIFYHYSQCLILVSQSTYNTSMHSIVSLQKCPVPFSVNAVVSPENLRV